MKFTDSPSLSPIINYLKSRRYASVLVTMLMLGFIYQQLTGSVSNEIPDEVFTDYSRLKIYTTILALISLSLKFPRWTLYVLLLLMVLIQVAYFTQIISKLDHDEFSTRDAAVEMTTQAFLQGKNPWNNVYELSVPATTGPASILFALPTILAFGEINWLAFFFWCVFFVILLIGDIQEENNTFPILVMLFVIGIFGYTHTLNWSLEEFYFPYLFIMFAYWSIIRSRYVLSGILLAVAILFRLNYVFIVLGFLMWYCIYKEFSVKIFLKIGIGAIIATIIILTPFILIGGRDFLEYNPFSSAVAMSGLVNWPANNVFFRLLNFLGRMVGEDWMRIIKLVMLVMLMSITSLSLRRLHHPFIHITFAAFLTITVAWISPELPNDYILFFIIPAFIAISLAKGETPGPNLSKHYNHLEST
ncbi:MAG: hypothetical protein KAT29_05635 [Anaerolineales bacterium]|nr:hypothetical protein [Anaerolineales bacterium]